LTGINQLLQDALKHVDPLRGFELAATLSRLHRVQGSDDIVVAVEHVAQLLDEMGIEHRVEVLRGPLGLHEHWGLMEPRGWRLHSARVEVSTASGWREVVSTSQTPLAAAAGSPPGEAEGRASPYPEEGTVYVTSSFSRIAYYDAIGRGVAAVAAYHRGPGVRYWGLYPPLALPEPPHIPAASIPLADALKAIEDGARLRVTVEAELHTLPPTPVLYAWTGSGPREAIMIAHICHPRPGSHDNASGVATAVEALAALNAKRRILEERGLKVSLLLVPEWTGTAAAIQQSIVNTSNLVSAVSVDMVSANLYITGGELRVIRGPPPLLNPLDPILDAALHAASVEGYSGPATYEMGSDHDVTLGQTVPSTMLNEWPDYYYHTSLDTPDHLSVERLARIAAALAAAHQKLAEELENAGKLALQPQIYSTYTTRCPASLLDKAAEIAAARAKGDYEPSPPGLNPPILASYLYHAGLEDEARRMMRERDRIQLLNTYLTVLAATGSADHARATVECTHQKKMPKDLEELAKKIHEGQVKVRPATNKPKG
jgi:hypothetical protein